MSEDPNYWNDVHWPRTLKRRLSRRRIMQLGALGLVGSIGATYLGCGDDDEEGKETSTPAAGSPTGSPAAGEFSFADVFGPGGADAGQGLTIKMGALLPFSGPGSYYGEFQGNGLKLGVKHVKEAGGPTIELVDKDHKSGDVTAGTTAARELATQDKVPLIFASYGAVLGSILPVIQQFHVLTLDGGGGTSQVWKSQDFFWGTRMVTPDDTWPGVLDYAKEKMPDAKRVASVAWDVGPANDASLAIYKQLLADRGMELVADERVQIGLTDYSTTLARVRQAEPDIVGIGLWGLDPGYFMKQYITTGLGAQVIGPEFTPDAAQVAGDAYDNYWFAYDFFDAANPPNPWSKYFADTYRQEYDKDADFYSANYYEKAFIAWELVKRVLKKGGDVNSGDDLQAALEDDPTFRSVYGGDSETVGELTLDVTEHAPKEKAMVIGTVVSGKPKILARIDKQGIVEEL